MASIPELAEEADRIAANLRRLAEALEAIPFPQATLPDSMRDLHNTAVVMRKQAEHLAEVAAQYPRAQSRVIVPDRITPALILSMITEAAVALESTQGGLLLIGADLLSGAASPAQVAKAMDSARDTIADGAKALVVLGQIIGEGLPLDQPTAGGLMVQMKPDAFQRAMSHLFAVQEWIAGESIGAKHARESLKRAIAIMRGDSEQIEAPAPDPGAAHLKPLGFARPEQCRLCGHAFAADEVITWCGGCEFGFCANCLGEPDESGHRKCKTCAAPAADSDAVALQSALDSLADDFGFRRIDITTETDPDVAARAAMDTAGDGLWVVRFRVHERDAEADRIDLMRSSADTLARFAGIGDHVFVMAGRTVILQSVPGDEVQVMKLATFAREQFGWVMIGAEQQADTPAPVTCASCGKPIPGTPIICAICNRPNHPDCIWHTSEDYGPSGVCCMPF